MASPSGIFVDPDISLEDLKELRDIFLGRAAGGDTTSLSGAGRAKAKRYDLSVREGLREVNYAIRKLTGTLPPRRTHFNAAGNCMPSRQR